MAQFNAKRLIIFTISIQLLLLSGCRVNFTDYKQNNLKQGKNTMVENKAINTYSIVTKNTSRILGNNAEGISLATACMIWPANETGNNRK